MKKIVYTFALVLACLFCQVMLVSCNEKTFENAPWEGSNMTASRAVEKIRDSKIYMLHDLGLPLKYVTTTRYVFFNDDYTVTNFEEVDTTILGNNNDRSSIATINKKYTKEGKTFYEVTTTYPKQGGHFYRMDETTNLETDAKSKKYLRRDYPEDQSFIEVLKETIQDIQVDEISVIQEKTFDKITYYRLSSEASTLDDNSVRGLDAVMKRFTCDEEGEDMEALPSLFKKRDNPDALGFFYYVFGIDNSAGYPGYLTYFSIEYDLEKPTDIDGERSVYLKVSSITKLDAFGMQVELPQLPEDRDLYTASTFMDVANNPQNQIVYKANNPQTHIQETVEITRFGEMYYFVKTQEGSSNKGYYYAEKNDQGIYVDYELSRESKTYREDPTVNVSFVGIDFNKTYSLISTEETAGSRGYQFGNEGSGDIIKVVVTAGEVYSVSVNGHDSVFIDSYKVLSEMPSDFIKDLTNSEDWTFIPSAPPEQPVE